MDAADALGRIIEAGKGAGLRAALDNVAETTASSGERRHGLEVMRALERMLACRDYAKTVLQMCHWLNGIEAASPRRGDYLGPLYALERVMPASFRNLLGRARWRRPGFELAGASLIIRYDDGRFELHASRMPVLCALLELLVETVGYAELDDALQAMLAEAGSGKAIGAAANRISRALYAYLAHELPSQQQSQKFRALAAFLETRAEDGAVTVDDDTVLAFWCQASAAERSDFRSFVGVLDGFVDFCRALQASAASTALAQPLAIGLHEPDLPAFEIAYHDPDLARVRLAGEVAAEEDALDQAAPDDASALTPPGLALTHADATLALVAEWQSPLCCLALPPVAAIKFLNKQELGDLARVMALGPLAVELPLSVLRADVFGADQARLTQARRNQVRGAQLATLVEGCGTTTYRDRAEIYARRQEQIGLSMKASLHILASSSAPAQVISLLDRAPVAAAAPDPDALREDCRRAFRRVNRKGFEQEQVSDEGRLEALRLGAGALCEAHDSLMSWRRRLAELDATEPDLGGWFGCDRPRFLAQFHAIYGTAPCH